MNSFNKLVNYYLVSTGLSEEVFAQEFNKGLTVAAMVHMSIDASIAHSWATYDLEPDEALFRSVILNFPPGAQDWRLEFAFCALALLKPEQFDLDGGKIFGLAERIVKFQILNSENAKAVLARVLEAEHV